ncbi:MAG: hypothetical protein IPJ08_20325 [Burkholderiales bacterium]|nr:hypothetical protein [Burkholderiales bacterium]
MKPPLRQRLPRALCLCLLLPAWVAAEPEALVLRHDPFLRPGSAAAAPALAAGADTDAAWRPQLRAVVVAGPKSSALVDGQVLELGDELDGYRLIQVLPDKAILRKKGRRVELSVGASKAAR